MWFYLGLTGNIACGKSTAAKMFEELGCYTIDADNISRIVMSSGEEAYNKIIEKFGKEILQEDSEIDRKKLGLIIFNDSVKKKELEEIVHPAIFNYEKKLISEIKSKKNSGIIITQAALTVETGSYERFDALIFVYTDEDIQLKRLIKREGITEEYAKKMIHSQMPQDKKSEFAQFIIDNRSDLKNLEYEVKRVYNSLMLFHYAGRQLRKEDFKNIFRS